MGQPTTSNLDGWVGVQALVFVLGGYVMLNKRHLRCPASFQIRNETGIMILTVCGGYQSQKMGLFPFNPPLRG